LEQETAKRAKIDAPGLRENGKRESCSYAKEGSSGSYAKKALSNKREARRKNPMDSTPSIKRKTFLSHNQIEIEENFRSRKKKRKKHFGPAIKGDLSDSMGRKNDLRGETQKKNEGKFAVIREAAPTVKKKTPHN